MERINHLTAAEDLHGAGKDGFAERVPGISPPTVVPAKWLNEVQEEILGVIEAVGLPPAAGGGQMATAFANLRKRTRLADALLNGSSISNILSSSHNWNCGAISNTSSDPSLFSPRYWVCGDDGAGNEAIAYAGVHTLAGGSWVDESGTPGSGTLTRCAADGTLCMGIGGTNWLLGGSTNAAGTFPGLTVSRGITYDPVNSLWIAACEDGIYTSPRTSISWTQREAGNFNDVKHVDGVNYAVAYVTTAGNSEAQLYTSTDGTTWASQSGLADSGEAADSGTRYSLHVSDEGVFVVMEDYEQLWRHTGSTFTNITPAGPSPAGATVWDRTLCLEGVYISHGAAADQWRGVNHTQGVGTVLSGGDHGMISTQGSSGAYIFPTPRLESLPYAT